MALKAFILTITMASISCIPENTCNRIKIGDHWYEREILWANLERTYNLNIHKSSNTLFFGYSVQEMYADVDFQLAYYNLDTKEYQTIAGIRGGCSVAVDSVNDEIYLGGSEGIYKYNMMTKIADFYKEKGKNIWALFYNKNLFYISYPEQKLYMELDGKFAIVKEFEHFEIDHFHVTSDSSIYFANKTGLYKYNNNNGGVDVVNELITVRQIAEDNDGSLYICTNFGIFLLSKFEGLKRIVDTKNVYGMSFDRQNNLIMSDAKSIIRLTYSTQGCDTKEMHW